MAKIYSYPEKYRYFFEDKEKGRECVGVGLRHKGKEFNIMNNGDVIANLHSNFNNDDLCTLCIMFLLINKPEVITEETLNREKLK